MIVCLALLVHSIDVVVARSFSTTTELKTAVDACLNGNCDGMEDWDVSAITSMENMFKDHQLFNKDISGWDVSRVTNFYAMFYNADSFQFDISSWDVSSATSFSRMFQDTGYYNFPCTVSTGCLLCGEAWVNSNADTSNMWKDAGVAKGGVKCCAAPSTVCCFPGKKKSVTSCTECDVGQYQNQKRFTGTSCTPCSGSNTYQDQTGQSSCKTDCGAESFINSLKTACATCSSSVDFSEDNSVQNKSCTSCTGPEEAGVTIGPGNCAAATCVPGWHTYTQTATTTKCSLCVVSNAATYSSECTIATCSTGYSPNSDNTNCVADACAPTQIPHSNKATQDSITGTTAESVDVTCDDGYTSSTTTGSSVQCQSSGTFTSMTCDPNPCASNFNTANISPTDGSGANTVSGATHAFTCATGYAASGVATCINGVWNTPTCVNVDECSTGANNCDVNAACTDTVGGFTCSCNTGYQGNGVTSSCMANDCTPTSVTNSDKSTAGSITGKTGDAVPVACTGGYQGSGSATCQNDGTFTTVVCAADACSPTQIPHSNKATQDSITGITGHSVDVTCDEGYTSSSTTGSSVQCQSSSTFTSMTCDPNPCGSNFNTANISPTVGSGANTASGATHTFTCSDGFTASGVATCAVGSWSSPFPTCDPNPCGSNFNTANISPTVGSGANTASGATHAFTCAADYVASGVATCTNGVWNTPTCESDTPSSGGTGTGSTTGGSTSPAPTPASDGGSGAGSTTGGSNSPAPTLAPGSSPMLAPSPASSSKNVLAPSSVVPDSSSSEDRVVITSDGIGHEPALAALTILWLSVAALY